MRAFRSRAQGDQRMVQMVRSTERAGYRLRCDCKRWSCPVGDGVGELAGHTVRVHRRQPTPVERTPRLLEDMP